MDGPHLRPAVLLMLFLGVVPCRAGAQPTSAQESLRLRVEQLHDTQTTAIRGVRLLQPDAVAHFFQSRAFEPAWPIPAASDQIWQAIRNIESDGLVPADYHLAQIEAVLSTRSDPPSGQQEADLQLLLTDALAAMIDHVRYGKVRPVSLDPTWNVDPRAGAPPLDAMLATLASAPAIGPALESLKPGHFIYKGLKGSLARMRAIVVAGGWPAIPAGTTLKPRTTDARITLVRKRLAVTGELPPGAPTDSRTYDETLRESVARFQERHRLSPDGVIGRSTLAALNVSAAARLTQVRVNLERARWVIGGLSDSFVLVNLPAFKVYLIRDGKNVWESRTQIGRDARRTPAFRGDIRYIVLNPDWTVPPTILAQDVLAGMKKGENTIAQKHLLILDRQGRQVDPDAIDWAKASPAAFPYTLRQLPGPDNALGQVKFMFPNEHSIFLHDTPSQELFAHDQRTFSSGCIRVEHALEFARALLEPQGDWAAARIQDVIESKRQRTVTLKAPLPVLIVYWTVSVGASGELHFARDAYDLDAVVHRALDAAPSPARIPTAPVSRVR